MEKNTFSLTSLCASLSEIMGVEIPKNADIGCQPLVGYAQNIFKGETKNEKAFSFHARNFCHLLLCYGSLHTAAHRRSRR